MKTYTVIDKDGNFKNIKKSYKPKRDLIDEPPIDSLTGEPERAEWLQLESIDDGFGNMVPTLTVDQIKKDQIIAADAQAKIDQQNAEAQDQASKDVLLDKLIAFDPDAISNINDIKQAFKDLKDYFGFKYKDDVAKKKGKP